MAAAIKRPFTVIHMTVPYMFTPQPPMLPLKTNHVFESLPMKPRPVHDKENSDPNINRRKQPVTSTLCPNYHPGDELKRKWNHIIDNTSSHKS